MSWPLCQIHSALSDIILCANNQWQWQLKQVTIHRSLFKPLALYLQNNTHEIEIHSGQS